MISPISWCRRRSVKHRRWKRSKYNDIGGSLATGNGFSSRFRPRCSKLPLRILSIFVGSHRDRCLLACAQHKPERGGDSPQRSRWQFCAASATAACCDRGHFGHHHSMKWTDVQYTFLATPEMAARRIRGFIPFAGRAA
jgi:hypothetical protein